MDKDVAHQVLVCDKNFFYIDHCITTVGNMKMLLTLPSGRQSVDRSTSFYSAAGQRCQRGCLLFFHWSFIIFLMKELVDLPLYTCRRGCRATCLPSSPCVRPLWCVLTQKNPSVPTVGYYTQPHYIKKDLFCKQHGLLLNLLGVSKTFRLVQRLERLLLQP